MQEQLWGKCRLRCLYTTLSWVIFALFVRCSAETFDTNPIRYGVPSMPKTNNRTIVDDVEGKQFVSRSRRLAPSIGTNSVLIVRVSGNGGSETTSTVDMIRNVVFQRSPSAASQLNDCSYGALTIEEGGSVEITLPYSVSGRQTDRDETFLEDMRQQAEESLGLPVPGNFDHVLYCLPEGTTVAGDPAWVGFAELGGVNSFYNDGRCESTITVLHELGHNYGLGHSTQLSQPAFLRGEYEDETCVMGIDDGQTRKCFNAPKSNALGWYDEGYYTALENTPGENILNSCLFGVSEYSTKPDPSEFQLWYQIGDIFISFNRDEGPNGQTQECRDKVVIHQSPTTSPDGVDESSDLLACVQEGGKYIGDGFTLVVNAIDVGSAPGCARVSILVDDTASPTTPSGTSSPTNSPEPTSFPTTEMYRIDYFINSFENDDDVEFAIIDSCGTEVLRRTVGPNRARSGQFSTTVEDQYKFVITDGGRNGGSAYSLSYRGVQQVENTNWNTEETCHLIGEPPPRCDGISCGDETPPSTSPVGPAIPTPAPILITNPPIEIPTSSPVDVSNAPVGPTLQPRPPSEAPAAPSDDGWKSSGEVEISADGTLFGENRYFYTTGQGRSGGRRESGRRRRQLSLLSREHEV